LRLLAGKMERREGTLERGKLYESKSLNVEKRKKESAAIPNKKEKKAKKKLEAGDRQTKAGPDRSQSGELFAKKKREADAGCGVQKK